MAYDSRIDTYKHIATVRKFIKRAVSNLLQRAEDHDLSKLESPEKEIFDEFTPKLATSTYGSEEYTGFLVAMKPALDHHYKHNRHHPEYFAREFGEISPQLVHQGDGIRGMDLLDLLEMLCDWKAATLRHNNGCILRSIEINQKRFGYSNELKQILLNTVAELNLDSAAEPS